MSNVSIEADLLRRRVAIQLYATPRVASGAIFSFFVHTVFQDHETPIGLHDVRAGWRNCNLYICGRHDLAVTSVGSDNATVCVDGTEVCYCSAC